MYPADLPTVRNALSLGGPANAADTCDIHLSQTPAPPIQPPPQSEFPRVRGYLIQSFIGSGGMGVVYKARHIDLQRTVALKMLHESTAVDREAQDRFQAEAEAVARAQHPNIIQVFEIGTVQPQPGEQKPRPFLSLEFMDGGSLSRYTETPQAPTFAARMVEKLARAAHAAHVLGVVHRDLKPANVLLTKDGEPKIADFGVAKISGEQERLLTQAGMTVGTPEYMAPEQAAGEDSGPAADIYSLGVILYQLLTARLPFHGSNPMDTMYLVRNEEPVSPRSFQPKLPRDLETICLKCLSKRPGRRYETAEALAEDLNRWAEGRTICARPVGRVERGFLWVRRNPTVAALSVAIVMVALIGIAGVVVQWRNAETKAHHALERERTARWEQYRADILAVSSAMQLDNSIAARRILLETPEEHRKWEWDYFQNQLDTSLHTLTDGGAKLHAVGMSAGADRVLTLSDDDTFCNWDVAGLRVRTRRAKQPFLRNSSMDPTGTWLAYVNPAPDIRHFILMDLKGDEPDRALGSFDEQAMHGAFTADGKRLAACSAKGAVKIWETATGKELLSFSAHPNEVGRGLSFNADGTLLATTGSFDCTAKVWNAATGELLHTFGGHDNTVDSVAFNSANDRLLVGSVATDNWYWLWNLETGEHLGRIGDHANHIKWAGFSPCGAHIATVGLDQKVQVWDGRTGKKRHDLSGHTGWVVYGCFSPDGTRFVTASSDRTLRLWDPRSGQCMAVMRGHKEPVLEVGYSKDGRQIVSTSRDGTVKIWDAHKVENGHALRGHANYVYGVACHPDNDRIASASWDGTIRIWRESTGERIHTLDCGKTIVSSVAFHPGGKLLASIDREFALRLWDVDTGREVHRFAFPNGHWMDTRVAFSPDGRFVASCDNLNTVLVFDVNERKEYARLVGHKNRVRDLAFSPDSQVLATAAEYGDATVRIWNLERKECVAALRGHDDAVYSLAFHPDGGLLASGSTDGTVRLWETRTWEPAKDGVLNHFANVYGLVFTPDGTRLASGCSDRSIRLWDVQTRAELAELRGHGDYVHSLAFTPDGTRLVSGSGDKTARIWDSRPVSARAKLTPNRP